MSTVVVVEHDGTHIRPATRSAVTVARELAIVGDGTVAMLVLGSALESVEAEARFLAPVIVADSPLLRHSTADRYARVIAEVCVARAIETIVAASTTFAKDILPRTAALLSASMVTDVNGYSYEDGQLFLRRPMHAGAITATVALIGQPKIITVRATNFPPALPTASKSETIRWVVDESALPRQIEYVGLDSRATSRPDVTEARVVVSGGRAFRTSEEFEQYVGQLADALGGATGCTRALVDAGIAPNEWQVGQTGKVVAPELYFALGLSGAVQHLAGMKNSRVVVAVNNDPCAPIFSIANYGLVGDVRELVPQLIERLAQDG